MFVENDEWEILGADGKFYDFSGMVTSEKMLRRIRTAVGSFYASDDHVFIYKNKERKLADLPKRCSIKGLHGKVRIRKTRSFVIEAAYDVVGCNAPNSLFIINNAIVTHNCDELAFVKPIIQEEFWTSILPTLSTGGSCIISSTPNGDTNLFAQLWRQANSGTTAGDGMEFKPLHVTWDAPPGRDEKFKQNIIRKLGPLKWAQEYECAFVSSDALLIDSQFLQTLKDVEPIREVKEFKFWDSIYSDNAYIVLVDPATGTGADFSVIDVFHFPSLNQVAQLRTNTLKTPELYLKLKWVLLGLQNKGCEVYFTIENNGVGEGLIALYMADENPPADAMFVGDETKREGMNTQGRSKLRSCIAFKELIEGSHVKINSEATIRELKSFVRKAGSYQAQVGANDDCVSTCLLLTRVLHEISSYEEEAFDKMYRVADDGTVYNIAERDAYENTEL